MVPTQDVALLPLHDAVVLASPDTVPAAVIAAVLVAFAVALVLTAIRRRDAD